MSTLKITVWNELLHEKQNEEVRRIYPDGIHTIIANSLAQHLGHSADIRCATLAQPQHGLNAETLNQTDVLFWWGHMAHDQVQDEVVDCVFARVLQGMGLIALHSAHASKIFRRLMGTGCMLRWREAAERERLWIVDPSHAIAAGLESEYFELNATEMYGEFFDIPQPDELVFISWFQGGEVFRSGCTWRRGRGRIFYFRPGHETYPVYHNEAVQQVLANAARWCSPQGSPYFGEARHIGESLEEV